MPLRGRFPLCGLAMYGDSIRMSLMIGSEWVKIRWRLVKDLIGNAPEKNLNISYRYIAKP
jgi:hypothetical protein